MNEDSDDDFGYDFSPDEELALAQLASCSSIAPLTVNPPPQQTAHQTAALIDSVPQKTLSQPSENHETNYTSLVSGETLFPAPHSIPASVHDATISYPNCMYSERVHDCC